MRRRIFFSVQIYLSVVRRLKRERNEKKKKSEYTRSSILLYIKFFDSSNEKNETTNDRFLKIRTRFQQSFNRDWRL